MDAALADLSLRVGQTLKEAGLLLATAESCTGGWVAQVVTHTAGSSEWFDCGFVSYSNKAKGGLLGVPREVIRRHGAVSEETAAAMAAGAIERSQAGVALGITGVAGPTGGSPDKPVGTVCFAWCLRGAEPEAERCQFDGDREAIRRQSVVHALTGLIERARNMP